MIGDDQWLVMGDDACQVPVEDRCSFSRFASEDSHKSTSHHAPRSMKCHQKSLEKKTLQDQKRHEMGCQRLPKCSQKLPKAPKRHPRAPQRLPKGAQVGPRGTQGISRGPDGSPKGSPGGPKGSQREPPGSKTSPRGAPGERSWNLLLGVPKKKHQNTAK